MKSIKLLKLLFCLIAVLRVDCVEVTSKNKVIMCFGSTQTGKSSFIKLNTGDQSIKCGKFMSGQSTTSEIRAHKDGPKKHPSLKNSYTYMDSVGLGDNTLKYNFRSFNKHIEMNLLKISKEMAISQISAIVITESYYSDSFTLTNIFQQITQIFGYFPKQSIVVLGTKRNIAVSEQSAEIRKNQLLSVLDSFQVPRIQFIDFYTPCPELNFSNIPESQFAEFENAVSRCKPIVMASVLEKEEAIKARAFQIQKQETRQKLILVDEQRVRYIPKTRSKNIQVPVERRCGGIKRWFGCTRIVWETSTIQQDYQDPQTYIVQVEKYIPDVPAYDYCYNKAFEEFVKENLEKLESLWN